MVTASLISPHCGGLRVPGKVERGFREEGYVRICGPTTQVPTSVHFWADAHGGGDREGELERGEERRERRGFLQSLSSFRRVIKAGRDKTGEELRVTNGGKERHRHPDSALIALTDIS